MINKIKKIATFCSEGAPYDHSDSRLKSFAIFKHHALRTGARLEMFSPRVMFNIGAGSLVQSVSAELGSTHNASIEKIGLATWAPAVSLLALEDLGAGDILFYNDVDVLKYRSYLDRIDSSQKMVDDIFKHVNDIFLQREFSDNTLLACQFCNNYQINEIAGDSKFTRSFPLLNVGMIVTKKTALSRQFLLEWLTLSRIQRFIRPGPTSLLSPSDYKHFTYVQSIGNMLVIRWIKEGLFPPNYPFLSYNRGGYPGCATVNPNIESLDVAKSNPQKQFSTIVKQFKEEFEDTVRFYNQIASKYLDGFPLEPIPSTTCNLPLHSWRPIDGGRISFTEAGSILLGNSLQMNWQMIENSSEDFNHAILEVRIIARPTNECRTGIHVHHYGLGDVCNFDIDGNIVFKSNMLLDASYEALEEGWRAYRVKFYNTHYKLMIGTANPRGYYEGTNSDEYEVLSITALCSPMHGKLR